MAQVIKQWLRMEVAIYRLQRYRQRLAVLPLKFNTTMLVRLLALPT
jgi:hypothetical protein